MSRFDGGRWQRILVWTGAALAWGTALIASRIDERPQVESTNSSQVQIASVSPQAGMPVAPAQGLVILRFTPMEPPEPRAVAVGVERSSPSRSAAPAPAVTQQAAPEPSSSGS
jgi:hypothetical protein